MKRIVLLKILHTLLIKWLTLIYSLNQFTTKHSQAEKGEKQTECNFFLSKLLLERSVDK